MYNTTSRQFAVKRGPLVCAVALLFLAMGCATPWEKSALLKDTSPNIERVQGPTQRSLVNLFKKKQQEEDAAAGKSLKPIAGTEEYLEATDLFKEERYEEARVAFKKVAKKFKKSEIREDALFMQAESAWKQDNYAVAHDAYAILLKEYPSTRHLNVVSERLFTVGRLWLDFPEVVKLGEIHQVNFDQPAKGLPSDEPPKLPKAKPLFVPNFRNKKEPLFDTPGNGVAALSAVWMNDPTGPLADDSMMLVASYHARKGNYVEADRFFQMLRETFPNSPHVQNAFVLGSHVKLMSYQGPTYEGRTLREAQLLKESTLRLYPNLPEADRIREELARIEDAKALEIWASVEFYMRKNKKRSAAVYCHQVINEYPKSPYAAKARAKLVELGPEYSSGAAFLTTVDPEKSGFEKFLETPVPYRLKRAPADSFRITPKAKTSNSAKLNESAPPKATSEPDTETTDRPKKAPVEDSPDEVEQAPVEPEKPTKPRRRSPRGSTPDALPEGTDLEAERLNNPPVGRARL